MSYSSIIKLKNLVKFKGAKPLYDSIVNLPIVTSGLILYLNGTDFLNSPPTNPWLDRSGQGNNATPSGFAYNTSSGSDGSNGVAFDGVNDYAIVNNVGDDATFTVEAKFIMSATAIGKSIISKANNATSGAKFIIDITATGTAIRFFGYNTSLSSTGNTTGVAVSANAVVCGSFVFDGTNFKTYINGVLQQTTPVVGTLQSIANNFYIGARYPSTSLYDRSIYNVKYYNRVLSDAEILQNYNATK